MTDYRNLPPLGPAQMKRIKRPKKFSQSLLSKWDACHRSSFLYLAHKNDPSSHAMMRGSAFHRFVEETVEYLIEVGENRIPGEVAKDRMMGLIGQGELVDLDDEGKERRQALVLPEFEQDALRAMAYNWGEATVIDPDKMVGLEQMIEMAVGPYTVRGKLDLAEITPFGAEVHDYKTSLAMPSQDELENGAKGFQLKFYAALMLYGKPEGESFGLGEGINEVRARLLFPRYTYEETGELVGREVSFERSDLADFMQSLHIHLDGLSEAFETGRFQAADGDHCSECPARSECPIPDALHSYPRIESREQAVELAKKIDFRDADQRRDRKALRGWIDENGEAPFPYNADYAYDFRPETKRSVDWEAVDGAEVIEVKEHVKTSTSTTLRRRKRTSEEKAAA